MLYPDILATFVLYRVDLRLGPVGKKIKRKVEDFLP
jgi:hypothetical protein